MALQKNENKLNEKELKLFHDIKKNPNNYISLPTYPTPKVLSEINKKNNRYYFSIFYNDKMEILYTSRTKYILYLKIYKYFQL